MAMRWMMALVEPPMAVLARMAFSKAGPLHYLVSGRRSSVTIATIADPASWATS